MNRTVRPLATLLSLLLLAACSMPEAPTRTALVFGVSKYDVTKAEGTYPNLTWTDDDAEAIVDELSSQGWIVIDGIADTSSDATNGSAAGLGAITDAIAGLAATEGLVLFYYSGHGGLVNGESAIVPYGTIGTSSDWITASELTAMFKAAGLDNVVIILDSCHSGGFVEGGATVDAIPDIFGDNDGGDVSYTLFVDATDDAIRGYLSYEGDSGYVVIAAAGAGEASYESATYGHGIFTYALLRGADSGSADLDRDGYVDTSELYAYCAAFIDENWNSTQAFAYDSGLGQYADYMPHLSGTAREYALWAVD